MGEYFPIRVTGVNKAEVDRRVTYIDGYVEIIDVKGYKSERDFPLRKKLFELKTGMELIVVRLKNKEWVRD